MAISTTLRGEIHNSIQHKLQNSMEVDSVGIIAILSMSYITTRIVKTQTSMAKIPTVPIENQITTLCVVKIAIKFSPCIFSKRWLQNYKVFNFESFILIRSYCLKQDTYCERPHKLARPRTRRVRGTSVLKELLAGSWQGNNDSSTKHPRQESIVVLMVRRKKRGVS